MSFLHRKCVPLGFACAKTRGCRLKRTRQQYLHRRFFSGDSLGIMSGMRVVELANVLAGPSCGQFLRELGAEVIKVENTMTRGDVTRTWFIAGENKESESAYFSAVNSGKKSIALNLKEEAGRQILYDIVSSADVVLASYKPGDAQKLKVDSETMRKLNSKLVYAEITGYGQQVQRAGYDAIIQAESGFMYMNGEPDSGPTKIPVALMDILTAHQLKEAILVSLWRREKTGEGSCVHASLLQSAISSLANQASGFLLRGKIPQRIGSDHPSIVPYGTVFETVLDTEPIVLAVGSDKQFKNLCSVLKVPDLSHIGSGFETNILRVKNRNTLKPILADAIKKWNRKDLLMELETLSVPAGAVNNMEAVFEQEQADPLVLLDEAGSRMGLRQVAFTGSPEGINHPLSLSKPPRYGEHTKEILRNIAGYSEERIKQLEKESVIEVE
mmetsp:Transcript_8502/g.11065  ORF Transcript_8502/g.11065 Transcript_8502/m.11065 type:complete len:442 (+) Transcript_8502:125-1450(+)